jgi:hypothetical protein
MASALGLFDGRFDAIKKGLKIGKVLAHAPPSGKPPRSPALLSIWGTIVWVSTYVFGPSVGLQLCQHHGDN